MHYCQSGGSIPVFAGSPIQCGSGLGQVLSGIFKTALPILKKTVLPAVVHSGKEVLSDVIAKKKGIKQALLDTGAKRLTEFVENVPGTQQVRPRKCKTTSAVTSGSKKRKINLLL